MRNGGSRNVKVAAWFGLILMLPACAAPGEGAAVSVQEERAMPRRIVSMNPCVDAILEQVAAPEQIAAISHYSQDPRATSVRLEWAERFRSVGDTAEDVVAARPDLVISGPHVAPQTAAALDRLGIPVLKIGVPTTVAESQAQIMKVAERIGRRAQAITLNQQIADAVEMMRPRQTDPKRRPLALIWQESGLVPGRGTLTDDLLRTAGFASASEKMGLAQWDMATLEQILLSPPDIIMTGASGMETGTAAGGNRMVRHPVLYQVQGRMMVADFPGSLLHCGGPVIIRTAARLRAIRTSWFRKQQGV